MLCLREKCLLSGWWEAFYINYECFILVSPEYMYDHCYLETGEEAKRQKT